MVMMSGTASSGETIDRFDFRRIYYFFQTSAGRAGDCVNRVSRV
jgi:hypothetical protein